MLLEVLSCGAELGCTGWRVFNPFCAIDVHGFVVATVFGHRIDIIAIGVSTLWNCGNKHQSKHMFRRKHRLVVIVLIKWYKSLLFCLHFMLTSLTKNIMVRAYCFWKMPYSSGATYVWLQRSCQYSQTTLKYRIHGLISAYTYFQNCKKICA